MLRCGHGCHNSSTQQGRSLAVYIPALSPWAALVRPPDIWENLSRLTFHEVGGIYVVLCAKLQHQKWQIIGAIAVQTACVGALSTATMDDPVKSVVLTAFVSFCVTVIMMNCFVLIGFGISNQDDM